jgi:hypothetical protein
MSNIKTVFIIITLVLFTQIVVSYAKEPVEVSWESLIPPEMTRDMVRKGTILDENIKFGLRYDRSYFPLVQELNGEKIRIAGFALPLEFEGTVAKEFLLVPYVGACIHAPPPLPNQIVYVSSKKGFISESLYTPVWVTGKMRTEGGDYNLDYVDGVEDVTAGYSMSGDYIESIKPR